MQSATTLEEPHKSVAVVGPPQITIKPMKLKLPKIGATVQQKQNLQYEKGKITYATPEGDLRKTKLKFIKPKGYEQIYQEKLRQYGSALIERVPNYNKSRSVRKLDTLK